MATPNEAAVLAQVAAALLAAPRDSIAANIGADTIESAVRTAAEIYRHSALYQLHPKQG